MSRDAPPKNFLQQIYNLNANTPGKYLLPAVQGTMDVSQQWPLPYLLRVFDFTALAGTNSVVVSRPPNNTHELILMLYYTISTPGTTQTVLFITNTQNSGPTANMGISRVTMSATVSQIPLIGPGLFFGGTAPVQGQPKPLYVPFPYSVTTSVVGAAGGEAITLRSISLRLPASQPFQALLDLW